MIVLAIGISSRFINIGTQGILIDETWVVPNTNFHYEDKNIYPKLFTYPEFKALDETKQDLIRRIYDLHPLFQIAAIRAVSDVHPPLFFFLNYYWGKWFGYKVQTIRTPAAIYFILTLFLLLFILRKQQIAFAPIIFILSLVVLSPIYLFFSNFSRPYTLLLLLTLLSSYFSYLVVNTNFEKKTVFYYILTSVACLYTHYYGVLVIVSQALYLFIEARLSGRLRKYLGRLLKAEAMIAFLFLPWAFVIIFQYFYRYPETSRGLVHLNLEMFFELVLTFSLAYSRSTLFSPINILLCIIQLGLFVSGTFYLWKRRNLQTSRFWLFFFICPLTLVMLLNFIQPVFRPRYCSIALIPYMAICGFGLHSISRVPLKTAFSLVLGSVGLYFVFYGLSHGNVRGAGAMEDWKSTGNFIKNLDRTLTVYVYHPIYRDALYYYIPDMNRIRGLEEEFWNKGPNEREFIVVDMNPEGEGEERKLVKELPFLKQQRAFAVDLIGHFPHIRVYHASSNL